MDSIKIQSSTAMRIAINDDPERVIEFDPLDAAFAERAQQINVEWQAKVTEFQDQVDGLEMGPKIALVRELCELARNQIDRAFGPGTSQVVFGGSYNLEMIGQFLNGVGEIITRARSPKLDQYVKKSKTRTLK